MKISRNGLTLVDTTRRPDDDDPGPPPPPPRALPARWQHLDPLYARGVQLQEAA